MSKPNYFTRFIHGLNHFKRSFKNFFKSSFLSLLIITIILLLLTQMDQAFTMLVDLIENKASRFSLFLSFLLINALAIVLSHYPIYTYYAANLNNSRNYTVWKELHPFNFWPLKRFPVYVFTTKKGTGYKPDNWANYLRYSIGLLIHMVWIHFIVSSFAPNLIFENFPLSTLRIVLFLLMLVPFIVYILLKEKFTKYQSREDKDGNLLSEEIVIKNGVTLNKLYKRLGVTYFLVALLCFVLLVITLFVANFSPAGLVVILLTSYAFMFNYVFFRLLRTRLLKVKSTLNSTLLLPVSLFISRITFLQKSENYLGLFNINFIISVAVIVYATIASIQGWGLNNGIPVLLAFFYFYYFIIASLGKYFFVAKKLSLFNTRKFKILFVLISILIVSVLINKFFKVEVFTHQLDLVPNEGATISEMQFIESLELKNSNTLFFIASHGGGLKANVWTLNVVNMLQEETQGRLLDQTVAFSGASGGSLGLALYTGLYRMEGKDTKSIQTKIDSISSQNYTSIDLAFTFGLDTYRKLWPFNQRIGVRDRPYYKMRKYQNAVEDLDTKILSEKSFRLYWYESFQKTGYFPSLIMNTAGMKGNRGIFWSVKPENFNAVFPFAENLADLNGNKTLPFYQAVSTTNRFPVFSPAAKIPGYGHYIDAGAIDNSGLLGCLDVHNYLLRNSTVANGKTVAYIEIVNSKSLYINYLLEKFKEENDIIHIAKDEFETDNIIADLQTGLNLDKIPGYLSDYMENWTTSPNYDIRYFEIFMPHKVSLDDVKSFIGGDIKDQGVASQLERFLLSENNHILTLTEKPDKSFFDPWEFYEPTLSRHLSKSSIKYVKAILNHRLIRKQFDEIQELTITKDSID